MAEGGVLGDSWPELLPMPLLLPVLMARCFSLSLCGNAVPLTSPWGSQPWVCKQPWWGGRGETGWWALIRCGLQKLPVSEQEEEGSSSSSVVASLSGLEGSPSLDVESLLEERDRAG